MDHLLKISKQTLWQILGKIITSVSTFIILAIISRSYGALGTGIFTLSLTYLAVFYLLADFGFNAHVLKNLEKGQWQRLLGTRIIWSLVLIGLSIILLPFFSFVSSGFNQAIILGSFSIVGFAMYTSCNLIFQSKHRYDLSFASLSIGILIGLGLYIWFTQLSLSVSWLLLANSLSWTLIALISLLLIKRFMANIEPVFDFEYIKKLLWQTWPIAATLALNVVYFRIDSFLVTFYKGISEAGIYNIAYSVFQSALALPTFIMNAYYPMMLKSLSKIKVVGVVLLAFSLIGTGLTIFLSSTIINILTGGKEFLGAVVSLQILSYSFPAFFLSSLLMWLLIKNGHYKRMLGIYALGLLFNLGMNLLFIPHFSYIAASWITVFSEYLILLLLIVSLG